jgi:hypothetical protein
VMMEGRHFVWKTETNKQTNTDIYTHTISRIKMKWKKILKKNLGYQGAIFFLLFN